MQYNHAVSLAASVNTDADDVTLKDVIKIRKALLAQVLLLSDEDLLANVDVFDTTEESLLSTEDHFNADSKSDAGLIDIGAFHLGYTKFGCCLPTLDLGTLTTSQETFLLLCSEIVYLDQEMDQHLRRVDEDRINQATQWINKHHASDTFDCEKLLEAVQYFSYFRFDTEPSN